MNLDSAKVTFVQEARELLDDMEKALLLMEQQGANAESINSVFRAAHTIKGSAGLFGMDHIVYFTHILEGVLDQIRSGHQNIDVEKIALFLGCNDHIKRLIDAVELDLDLTAQDPDNRSLLLSRLQTLLPAALKTENVQKPEAASNTPVDSECISCDSWHISLRLSPDIFQSGMDPISFIRYLGSQGKILHVETVTDNLPIPSEMNPEMLYLGFEIQFESSIEKEAIANVFEFVSEGSNIRILPPRSKIQEYIELIDSLREPTARLGEILLACKALTKDELNKAMHIQEACNADVKPPLGQILVEQCASPSSVVAAALSKQLQAREKHVHENRQLKVDVNKLDSLINLVGELVIANAAARISVKEEGARQSEEVILHMSGLVENIRDAALGLRMVPVGDVFQRFPRVVHDLSKELGKKIDLVITGADTELDKSMVEKVTDPLMHIVRNSMDHGIEAVEKRLLLGKSETGVIRLNAFHDSGSIVIEVVDDGAGMNRTIIRQKAIEKGVITSDQILNDSELLNLVFAPGFSTAEKVTNLSGRGVGMDVVKRNIESLRGEIDLESIEGQGTTIRIRLPLTLSIIDGFQVRVGELACVVPLDLVQECADLVDGCVQRNIVRLHEEPLPFIRLRNLFSIPGAAPQRESLLVVQYGSARIGLVVDQLMGELQAVIKPMGELFAQMKGIVGTTIMGNGSVALILDIPHLSQNVITRASSTASWEEKRIA